MEHSEISGYTDQSAARKAKVNRNKDIEERVLRILDELKDDPDTDGRWLAIGRTAIEQGFMAVNRSIFQPERIGLNDPDPIGSLTQREADASKS